MKKAALLFLLLPLAAAAPGERKLPVGALTGPGGFRASVELALTPSEQSRGLMFRTELKPGTGMLFAFPEEGARVFWMKNTFVDLDIIFLDSSLRVVKVFHRVPRTREDTPDAEIPRVGARARYVLELPAGAARAAGLRPGSALKYSGPPLKPRFDKDSN